MRESEVERYLNSQVTYYEGVTRKLRFLDRRGAPDRMVLVPRINLVALVEVKRPGEVPEPHQAREHERLRHGGMMVIVVDSKESVDAMLYGTHPDIKKVGPYYEYRRT